MGIVDYFSNHHDEIFYVISGLSFVIELTVLGLSGPLLFFAVASAVTGIAISLGWVTGWESELFVCGLLTGLTALLLWSPLKRFQNSGGGADTSSDMIGRQVKISKEITPVGGSIRYSGIDWTARLAQGSGVESLAADTFCVISGVDGNVMIVKPIEG